MKLAGITTVVEVEKKINELETKQWQYYNTYITHLDHRKKIAIVRGHS